MEASLLELKINAHIAEHRFNTIIDILKEFKDAGGTQLNAYRVSEKIMLSKRQENEEEAEDFLLEIMDIIAGYCSTERKIWRDNLKL